MPEIKRLELIKNLTRLEAQFSDIRFPAHGGLYLGAELKDLKSQHNTLDESIDQSKIVFVFSPDRTFYPILRPTPLDRQVVIKVKQPPNSVSTQVNIHTGPTISHLGIHIAKREPSRLSCTAWTDPQCSIKAR
ncbi:hypothetical protein BDV12DRAFT_34275 [Aspergillus spectabilis]